MNDKTEETNSCGGTSTGSSIPVLLVDDGGDVIAAGSEQDGSSSVYKYRDFSNVAEDDDDAVGEAGHVADVQGPVPNPSRPGSGETSIRVQKFPVKLYAILAQKEFHDIITWMPHGRSWKVLKPNVFESLVMPLFFEYSNYHSFNRLVNAWSFRRVSSGADRGSYYHELFLRGKPHLQKYMRRLPKTHKKLPMRKQDEPDFYMLDKTNRLPALEDAPVPGGLAAASALRQQQQQQQQQSGSGDLLSRGRNQHQQQPSGMRMPPPSFHHTVPRFSSSSSSVSGGGGMYPNENVNSVGDDYGDAVAVSGYQNPDVIPINSNSSSSSMPNSMSSRGLHQSHPNAAGAFRPPMPSNNMNNNSNNNNMMNPPLMRPFRQGPSGFGPGGMDGSVLVGGSGSGSFDQDGGNLNNNPDDLYAYNPGQFNNNSNNQQSLQSSPLTPQMNMNQRQHLNNSMSPASHHQQSQQQYQQQQQQQNSLPHSLQKPQLHQQDSPIVDPQMKHMNQMRSMQMQQMQHVYNERHQQVQLQPFSGNYNHNGPMVTGMSPGGPTMNGGGGVDQMYGGGGFPTQQGSRLPMMMMSGGGGGGGGGHLNGGSDGYSQGGGGGGGGMTQEEFAMMQQIRRPQPPIPKC